MPGKRQNTKIYSIFWVDIGLLFKKVVLVKAQHVDCYNYSPHQVQVNGYGVALLIEFGFYFSVANMDSTAYESD